MPALTRKEEYVKMVCLFLAEGLRTRRIGIKRAAEVAEKVMRHLNLLDTEADFLKLVKELAHDFEELIVLENNLKRRMLLGERRELEHAAKHYAVQFLAHDPQKALSILKDACQEDMTMEKLKAKYPGLKQ